MSSITTHVGGRIRAFRKAQGMTLSHLAEMIHKSRASVSKYENGEIVLDIETLHDISAALHVPLSYLMDYQNAGEAERPVAEATGSSPFYQAERLYFYFYDGRYKRLKDGVIDVHKHKKSTDGYEASLSIRAVTPNGRSASTFYAGKVVYSDMLIRFSFVNQYNTLEEDLLYIFNPLELRDFTEGLLCGISSADLMPCAFKCLVTLTEQQPTQELIDRLLFTKKELRRWQKVNMLLIDNHG